MVIGLFVLLILGVVLGALVPLLVSTQAGTRTVLAFVNGTIKGNVDVERLRLSWRGPIGVTGLEVADPAGRQVLQVSSVESPVGLWRLITNTEQFESVAVEAPEIELILSDDGTISLVEAFQHVKPSPRDTEAGPLPELMGRLLVRKGEVKIVRDDGNSYTVGDVDAELTLATLAKITGKFSLRLPDGATVAGDASVHDAVSDGAFDLAGASGSVEVRTDGRIQLAPIAEFALRKKGIEGAVTLSAKSSVEPGKTHVEVQGDIAGLRSAERAAAGAAPVNAKLTGSADIMPESTTGSIDLRGEPGHVTAEFSYKPGEGSVAVSGEDLTDLLLGGGSVELPDFSLKAESKVDLATLGRAVPELLSIRQDRQLSAGTLEIASLVIRGGDRPSASGSISLKDVAASGGESVARLSPIELTFDSSLVAEGLKVERLALNSGFANVTASGTAADLKANAEIQLAALQSELSQVFDMGLDELARYTGDVRLQTHLVRGGDKKSVSSTGQLAATGLQVDGKPLIDGETKLLWSDLVMQPDGGGVQIKSAQLDSPMANATVQDVRWQAGEHLDLQGQVKGSADVARCFQVVSRIGKWEKPPEIGGTLTWDTSGTASGQTLTLKGQAKIEPFTVGSGDATVKQEQLTAAYALKLDSVQERISIEQCKLTSRPLSLDLTGSIGEYTSARVLDLSGRYDLSWPELVAVLHQLAPATAQTITIAGTSSSAFTIKGPAGRENVKPTFKEVSTGLDVGWAQATVYGVAMGQAMLKPSLRDGHLILPEAAIPAADGRVRLRGDLDFAPAEPTLKVESTLQVLDNVAVTKELGAQLLSRINPIFLHVARIEGRVNLRLQDMQVPFGQTIKTTGAGQGHLDLKQMKLAPGPFLGELLALGGMKRGDAYPVEIGALDFVLKDGRIVYDNFSLMFPDQFDLKFRGSVGFDDTLDLIVSVPVRPDLLERLGLRGQSAEIVRLLAGSRVDIPIVGTRENPKLDMTRVDKEALLKGVLKQSPVKAAEDLLKLLPGGEKQK